METAIYKISTFEERSTLRSIELRKAAGDFLAEEAQQIAESEHIAGGEALTLARARHPRETNEWLLGEAQEDEVSR